MKTKDLAVEFCENALAGQRDSAVELGIYPGWPEIVDKLLMRRNELVAAYRDIHEQTGGDTILGEVFFDAILCVHSVWDNKSTKRMRDDRRRLEEVYSEMSKFSGELSLLMRERDKLENRNSFGAEAHYHVIDLITEASRGNQYFQAWVREDLENISARFDMKYWPSIAEVIDVISRDAAKAEISVDEPVTAAALSSPRSSKADFCRALMERVGGCKGSMHGQLPAAFHLKDETWASLVNCLMDLGRDEIVDGAYVKRLRQRDRDMSRLGA